MPKRVLGFAVVEMKLCPSTMDEGVELAVGLRVGPLQPVQPPDRVLGAGYRDQADEELGDLLRIRLEDLSAGLVQPRSDRRPCDVGVRHRHVASQSAAHDLSDTTQV